MKQTGEPSLGSRGVERGLFVLPSPGQTWGLGVLDFLFMWGTGLLLHFQDLGFGFWEGHHSDSECCKCWVSETAECPPVSDTHRRWVRRNYGLRQWVPLLGRRGSLSLLSCVPSDPVNPCSLAHTLGLMKGRQPALGLACPLLSTRFNVVIAVFIKRPNSDSPTIARDS